MSRARRARRPGPAAPTALLALLACEAPAPDLVPVAPGPDCVGLIAVAERAVGCDPRLQPLVAALRASPDEPRCRGVARGLLNQPTPARGRVVSVYERPPAPDLAPLSAAEHAGLAGLVLPGTLTLIPDLALRPGVPNTTATLDGFALDSDADGRLTGMRAPGEHLLVVRHADRESVGCVTLRACESLTVTTHGASLAPHPALRPGPCGADER